VKEIEDVIQNLDKAIGIAQSLLNEPPLTTHDISVLIQQDMPTLASWYCQLNEWEWPPELPDPEPRMKHLRGRRGAMMDWIESKIGHKECLRQHWKRHDIETPDRKFDDWYAINFDQNT